MQLYKHFLQLQDYNDRVKTAEQKLQVISQCCFSLIHYMHIQHISHTPCIDHSVLYPYEVMHSFSVSYQSLVDAAMVELDMAEDATTRDGSLYENGVM
jgi:hypothetical protein